MTDSKHAKANEQLFEQIYKIYQLDHTQPGQLT